MVLHPFHQLNNIEVANHPQEKEYEIRRKCKQLCKKPCYSPVSRIYTLANYLHDFQTQIIYQSSSENNFANIIGFLVFVRVGISIEYFRLLFIGLFSFT